MIPSKANLILFTFLSYRFLQQFGSIINIKTTEIVCCTPPHIIDFILKLRHTHFGDVVRMNPQAMSRSVGKLRLPVVVSPRTGRGLGVAQALFGCTSQRTGWNLYWHSGPRLRTDRCEDDGLARLRGLLVVIVSLHNFNQSVILCSSQPFPL